MTNANVDAVLRQLSIISREIINPLNSQPITTYENPPFSVAVGDEPAIVWLPAPMADDWQIYGESETYIAGQETRDYVGLLLVKPKGQGLSGEAFGLVTPYFAQLRDVLESHRDLGGLLGVRADGVIYRGDDGAHGDIDYAGIPYYGTRAMLRVITVVQVPIAQGE